MFDTNGIGEFDPKEIKAAMESLVYYKEIPTIYQLLCDLDSLEIERKGGITFEEFVNVINDKLGDKEIKEGIKRIFELFIDDPNDKEIIKRSRGKNK